jgi:hypothetical protein
MSGCFSIHQGSLSSDVIESNITYKETVAGEAKSIIILGLGGTEKNALVQDAKRDMEVKRFLKPNERYINFTMDRKDTYYFGLVSVQKLTLHADIVAINQDEDDPMSDEFKRNYFSSRPSTDVNYQIGVTDLFFQENEKVLLADGNEGNIIAIFRNMVAVYKYENNAYKKINVPLNEIFSTRVFNYKSLKRGDSIDISDKVDGQNKTGKIVAFGTDSALVKYADDSFIEIKYQDLSN